ncbi:MAG: polysaccharide biosynthesis/export family protein, partial [Pseudomonadota bacterium]
MLPALVRWTTVLVASSLPLLFAPAYAQLTPETLERLQRQATLGTGTSDPGTQLDRSRTTNQNRTTARTISPREETREEVELRRLRSRLQLDQLSSPSPIEDEYRTRLGDPDLIQFGYDIFQNASTDTAPPTGEVGGNYRLGVGDEVLVTFTGATNKSLTARVARDGRLIVDTLPPIQAAGRTLSAVRQQLEAQTTANMLGTQVYVSVGGIRAITVFVGGEVERPGQYSATSLADIVSALAKAGGIRRNGSLRRVLLYRGNRARPVDLYGLLGIGTPPSVSLQDGDRIVVPVIGQTVAIAGGVARPGIYELARDDADVDEL